MSGINQVVSPLQNTVESMRTVPQSAWESMRRGSSEMWHVIGDNPAFAEPTNSQEQEQTYSVAPFASSVNSSDDWDDNNTTTIEVSDDRGTAVASSQSEFDTDDAPVVSVPDQDIDYEERTSDDKKRNRKRLTEDLGEVKEKMHELTLHKFNYNAYVVKDANSRYFDYHQKPAKRRKLGLSRNLDKLLNVGQYSHPNPVVAKVGQYVEPIIVASHSFLCAFRALFNVMTWRDPFLTFWVSLIGLACVVILFIFPWRLAFFGLGLWFFGPQNWAIRILRKRGILPPKKVPKIGATAENMEVPSDQVVFQGHISQDEKRKPHPEADPREIQYAVVPYSPLMAQRFYDWPPERACSHVSSIPLARPTTLGLAQAMDPWTAASRGAPPERLYSRHPNSLFSSTVASLEKKTQ